MQKSGVEAVVHKFMNKLMAIAKKIMKDTTGPEDYITKVNDFVYVTK